MKMIDAQTLKKPMAFFLSKDMPISEISEQSPRAIELLSMYGLHCASCFANSFDTLENGALVHGMDEEEMETMIDEINEQLEKEFKDKSEKR